MQQSEHSFVAERVGPLLEKIREAIRKTLDAFQSEAFHGDLNEVSNVSTGDIDGDIDTTVACLLRLGMTREEEQRFCDEWERCCNECGLLYTLIAPHLSLWRLRMIPTLG